MSVVCMVIGRKISIQHIRRIYKHYNCTYITSHTFCVIFGRVIDGSIIDVGDDDESTPPPSLLSSSAATGLTPVVYVVIPAAMDCITKSLRR